MGTRDVAAVVRPLRDRQVIVREDVCDHTSGRVRLSHFTCETGDVLADVDIAYETWGRLNEARDNAVVVCHALTGDAHAGPGLDGDGWWTGLIGPERLLDTNRYYVIASNVLGGCAGSTGPASPAPDGRPYGLRFPLVSVRDIVRAQIEMIDTLTVDKVAMVIGGSLGGMQVWEWPLLAPGRVGQAVVVAAHAAFPALGIGYNEAMRQAIVCDPDWQRGDYYGTGRTPRAGLSAARTIGMLTYRSEQVFTDRFDRREVAQGAAQTQSTHSAATLPGSQSAAWGATARSYKAFTEPKFEVESYLHHHGNKLNDRFDANSYLYLTRAMDGHDIGRDRGGLEAALRQFDAQLLVVGIDSDYLYAPSTLRETAALAGRCGVSCQYVELSSSHGHDAFLIDLERLTHLLKGHGQTTGA